MEAHRRQTLRHYKCIPCQHKFSRPRDQRMNNRDRGMKLIRELQNTLTINSYSFAKQEPILDFRHFLFPFPFELGPVLQPKQSAFLRYTSNPPSETTLHSAPRPLQSRPVYAMSVALLFTFEAVNVTFYKELRKKILQGKITQNEGYDDENGCYIPVLGEEIKGRYIVQGELGRGSFGVVLKCHDSATKQFVAVKIIRNQPSFYSQAKVEIDILSMLNEQCPKHACIVKLLEVTEWKKHPVIVFELLSISLYSLLQKTAFTGVSLALIRKFATQLLQTLHMIHTLPQPIIHCDLKPENILLKDSHRSGLKIIDFGCSCYDTARVRQYIQTRFYRAPEIMLRLPYSTPIDLWSLGCILVELHTGRPLFPGKTEEEQLHRITAVLGPIPQQMIMSSRKRTIYFTRDASGGTEWG
eukprot:PhF_6_TR37632/c0_g2_i1/m.55978/K08825/DYRK1; dual specificity tyrosine-phosphorylation-regulated kinase 1